MADNTTPWPETVAAEVDKSVRQQSAGNETMTEEIKVRIKNAVRSLGYWVAQLAAKNPPTHRHGQGVDGGVQTSENVQVDLQD